MVASDQLPGGQPSLFVAAATSISTELAELEAKAPVQSMTLSRRLRVKRPKRPKAILSDRPQLPALPPALPKLPLALGSEANPDEAPGEGEFDSSESGELADFGEEEEEEEKQPEAKAEHPQEAGAPIFSSRRTSDEAHLTSRRTSDEAHLTSRRTSDEAHLTSRRTSDEAHISRRTSDEAATYSSYESCSTGHHRGAMSDRRLHAAASHERLRCAADARGPGYHDQGPPGEFLPGGVSGDESQWGYDGCDPADDRMEDAPTKQSSHAYARSSLSTQSTPPRKESHLSGQSGHAPPPRHSDKKNSHDFKASSTRLDLRRGRTTLMARSSSTLATRRCRIKTLEDLVEKSWFEPLFAVLILLNTCVMAAEMQYNGIDFGFQMAYPGEEDTAENTWPAAKEMFEYCEWIFGAIFTLELLIKVVALRVDFLKELWNWLDFMIVLFWAIGALSSSLLPMDPTLLRLVRLVRLMRLLRLVKTLQTFESLYLMTTSIKASILALMWSTVLLFLLQASIALVLNQLLLGYILDESNHIDKRFRVYRYFGTFSKSVLTMFEFMLANWPDASRVLTEDVSEFYLFLVLSYQCVISFSVVKVIMGVFLQVTFNVAATDDIIMLNQKERAVRTHTKKMSRLFQAADLDGSGYIDKEEFRNMVDDPVVRQWLSSMDCDVSLFAKDPDVLFSLVDDGDEELTAEELVKGVARMQGPARSIDLAILADENRQISDIVHELADEVNSMKQGPADPPPPAIDEGLMPLLPSRETSTIRVSQATSNCTSEAGAAGKDGQACEATIAARAAYGGRKAGRKTVSAAMFDKAQTKRLVGGAEVQEEEEDKPCWFVGFVTGGGFETLFGMLICLNSLVLAVEVQYTGIDAGYRVGYIGYQRSAKEVWPWAEDSFKIIDWFFLVVFTLEVLIKVGVVHGAFFKDPWNWFDLFLVLTGLVEKIAQESLPLDPALLRLARMVRLLRLLRLVRTIQGFDSLYLMTTSIKGSMQALIWFSVLMFVVQMLIALLLNMLLESYLLDEANPRSERHLVYRYFGTFSKAILTMFEITLANWIPVCRALTENVSEWYVIFALVHKFIIGFAVVMVITGVFLQETFKVASTDDTIMINQKQRQIKTHTAKMAILFKAADEDGNGILDRDEFKAMVADKNVVTWLSSMGLEVNDADDLFTMVNRESQGDDEITAADLVKGVARLKGHAKSIDLTVVLASNTKLLEEAMALQKEVEDLKEERRREFEERVERLAAERAERMEHGFLGRSSVRSGTIS